MLTCIGIAQVAEVVVPHEAFLLLLAQCVHWNIVGLLYANGEIHLSTRVSPRPTLLWGHRYYKDLRCTALQASELTPRTLDTKLPTSPP